MAWDSSLETGIPLIDAQHKNMFEQVAALLDPNRKGRVPEMLAFLGEYVAKHLETEENIQEKTRYPLAEQHRKEHAEFFSLFTKLKKSYEETGDKDALLTALQDVAMSWLLRHIMEDDRKFAQYCKTFFGQSLKKKASVVPNITRRTAVQGLSKKP